MEAGITDHVWTVQELVERALAAEPCSPPEPKKLAPPAPLPDEKPVTAKELPNGRGWLRVVQGGKSVQKDAPKMPTPVVEAPVVTRELAKVIPAHVTKSATSSTATIAIPVKLAPKRWEQMDLFGGDRVKTRSDENDEDDCLY